MASIYDVIIEGKLILYPKDISLEGKLTIKSIPGTHSVIIKGSITTIPKLKQGTYSVVVNGKLTVNSFTHNPNIDIYNISIDGEMDVINIFSMQKKYKVNIKGDMECRQIMTTIAIDGTPSCGYIYDWIAGGYHPFHEHHNGMAFWDTNECIGQEWQNIDGTIYYVIYRGYLFFDTSIIPPDTLITSAQLRLLEHGSFCETNFNLTVQNGQPTYPHNPVVISDYYYLNYSGNGGSKNTIDFIGTGVPFYIDLNSTGIGWINKGGITKFALLSDKDIASISPTSRDVAVVFSPSGWLENCIPQLIITYPSGSHSPPIAGGA